MYGRCLRCDKPSTIRVYYKGEDMTKKRFELKSYHFKDMKAIIYDHVKEKELNLSIYEIVNLLNEISEEKFEFIKRKKEIKEKIIKLGESLE